jgi:hypothetical protein
VSAAIEPRLGNSKPCANGEPDAYSTPKTGCGAAHEPDRGNFHSRLEDVISYHRVKQMAPAEAAVEIQDVQRIGANVLVVITTSAFYRVML